MKTLAKPVIQIKFSLEVECLYDSFTGKTPADFAEGIQDEIHELLEEMRPEVVGIFSNVESTNIVQPKED